MKVFGGEKDNPRRHGGVATLGDGARVLRKTAWKRQGTRAPSIASDWVGQSLPGIAFDLYMRISIAIHSSF